MYSFVLLVLFTFQNCLADTPANCSYDEIKGKWTVYLGKAGQSNKIKCNERVDPEAKFNIELLFPDIVVDEDENKGFWTMVYNQGFEFVIKGRKYFAFSKYHTGPTVISDCSYTFNGWVHDEVRDNVFPPKNWGCYYAIKIQAEKMKPKPHPSITAKAPTLLNKPYRQSKYFINQINKVQSSWTATAYKEYDKMTVGDLLRRSGVRQTPGPRVKPSPPSEEVLEAAAKLPVEFDWRNVNGTNYVSPVRNQGTCGSCYAFASMAMLESRIRIKSNNKQQPVLSTQNIVSCSEYSQGCGGGFAYLIGGKYSEDFGNIEEDCYPYKGKDSSCSPVRSDCTRFNATNYYYIGKFYGASSEPLMLLELVNHGPFAIAFEVYQDFQHYKGGIYHHTGLRSGFKPFELTNHAVLLVGYGIDSPSGEKYWIVKNSWGTTWGEEGFFRIRRGVDECACESVPVATSPVLE